MLESALKYSGAVPGEKSLPVVLGRVIKLATKYVAGSYASLAENSGQAILPTSLRKFGVTNFADTNKMPVGVDYIVTGIRVVHDVAIDTLACVWKTEAPAAFKNGELTISQGITLFNAPGTDVSNGKVATSNDDDFREVFFILRGGVDFNILFNTVGAMPVGSYRIELRGIERSETILN